MTPLQLFAVVVGVFMLARGIAICLAAAACGAHSRGLVAFELTAAVVVLALGVLR